MSKKLTIVVPTNVDGTAKHPVIRIKDGSEYGSVMVTTSEFSLNNGGMFESKRTCYFRAKASVLEALNLQVGDDLNVKLATLGLPALRIKRVESTTPAYEGQQQKRKGADGDLIFTAAGEPVYMQDFCAAATEDDQLISIGTPVAENAVIQERSAVA